MEGTFTSGGPAIDHDLRNAVMLAKSSTIRVKILDYRGIEKKPETDYVNQLLLRRKMMTVIYGTSDWTEAHTEVFNQYTEEIKQHLGL